MVTLYQYLHCPYCIRVRMALGFLNLPYHSVLLPYADEETPIRLTGIKMAPILQKEDQTFMNESLDIITYLDSKNLLNVPLMLKSENFLLINAWINRVSKPLFNLLMPYYLNSLEFSEADRKYFQQKKEKKRGPFSQLVSKRGEFILEIEQYLDELMPHLSPYYKSPSFTLLDLILASHLWGLYLAYEFRVPTWLHQYLQQVKNVCNFNYDADLWLKNSDSISLSRP